MTFRETLDKHLRAIRERDLDALAATLSADGAMVLVMSDGRLVRSAREFLDLHRDWFGSTSWTLDAEPMALRESPDMAFATLRLAYRDRTPEGKEIREASLLTLVFAREGDRWAMVLDQNTPIKDAPRPDAG